MAGSADPSPARSLSVLVGQEYGEVKGKGQKSHGMGTHPSDMCDVLTLDYA